MCMCSSCLTLFRRGAGKVKSTTPKVDKKEGKKKKTGRAKKRDQFNKINQGPNDKSNRTPRTTTSNSVHSKAPRFSSSTPEAMTSFRTWIQLLSSPSNKNTSRKHSDIENRSFTSDAGFNIKVRTHTQKNKGSTGRSIHKERNQASKIRIASVLYGEDYELEV